MFLQNTSDLRTVNWGKSYLWDVMFPAHSGREGAPKPFDKWFPAIDVEEELFSIEYFTFSGFTSTFKVPQGTTSFGFKVTFLDNIELTLENWFKDWVNTLVLQNGKCVATLDKSVRAVSLAKLDNQRKAISVTTYWVVPEGALHFVGDSQSSPKQFTVTFVIAGEA